MEKTKSTGAEYEAFVAIAVEKPERTNDEGARDVVTFGNETLIILAISKVTKKARECLKGYIEASASTEGDARIEEKNYVLLGFRPRKETERDKKTKFLGISEIERSILDEPKAMRERITTARSRVFRSDIEERMAG